MSKNINTKEYWDSRFEGKEKSWKGNAGEFQTRSFAKEIVKRLKMPPEFDGTILDFGCALGDAIPVYRRKYPFAKIIGVDFSSSAIEQCNMKFGNIATFMVGTIDNVPKVDTIVMSNVLEHLSNDKECVTKLLVKCTDLYIAVPYDEKINSGGEHINTYNENTFDYLKADKSIYLCRGYSLKEKLSSYINIELKNVARFFLRKPLSAGGVNKQVLFHISNK